jgi:hypothetical protein
MDNQQERLAFDIGWVVGIIEGEGSILLTKKPRGMYPSIQIGNCNQGVIDRLVRILNQVGVGCYVTPSPSVTKGGRLFKRVDVGGFKRLQKFFEVVKLDYFEGKWHEAYLLVEYLKIRAEKEANAPHGNDEESVWHSFKLLNR